MTKLKYPSNGIYYSCRGDLSSCSSMLTSACNSASFTIPSSFIYKTYMTNLKDVLNSYKTEMNNISDTLNKISKSYEDAEVDMTTKAKSLSNMTVKKRERLIRV